jgi:hypothetical protein
MPLTQRHINVDEILGPFAGLPFLKNDDTFYFVSYYDRLKCALEHPVRW